ncbi:MAG: WD40 repeat domain-containing protein [Myxococcota bacterium]
MLNRFSAYLLFVFGALAALSGCRTTQALSPGLVAQLKDTPQGYLSGEVTGIRQYALMNNRDFVYSVDISPGGEKAAFTHLGPKTFQLETWRLEGEPRQISDKDLNHYQYDVESLDFSPDGKTIVTASRDGSVRFFAAEDGAPLGVYATEEPLVSVAFHPSGHYVAAGSAKGLITLLSFPQLQFAFEQRAHEGEVRNLVFSAEGVLYSGGWDKSIVSFDSSEEKVSTQEARLRFERRGGLSVVKGMVSDTVPVAFAFDARVPFVVVTNEVAKKAGIDVPFLKETVQLATPMGSTLARVARGQSLTFKALRVKNVDLAICDACVPGEALGVLGEAFTRRYEVAFDEVAGEALLAAKEKSGEAPTQAVLTLKTKKRSSFDWYVNDFALDRTGRYLGVAFSEQKAERTREVYEREKKGVAEPSSEGNAGAIVDAQTGLIVRKWSVHQGVVATAAISPDGQTLVTGGWDKRLLVYTPLETKPLEQEFGWSVRRVRFSDDGRFLVVGAWTPQNPLGNQESNPSAVVYEVGYKMPQVQGGATALAR